MINPHPVPQSQSSYFVSIIKKGIAGLREGFAGNEMRKREMGLSLRLICTFTFEDLVSGSVCVCCC